MTNGEQELDDRLVTLSDACVINPTKRDLREEEDDTVVLFVPMAAVDEVSGSITGPEERTLGELRKKSYRYFEPRDVLFAKITPCMENGKSAVVPDIQSGIGFGSTEFHVLRPRMGTNPRYIWHLVRQLSFRKQAEVNMPGSVGQARVPPSFLEEYRLALPDEEVQEHLVQILDQTMRQTNQIRSRLQKADRVLNRARVSLLFAACSGRLSADWRDGNTPSRTAEQLVNEIKAHREPGRPKRALPIMPENLSDLPDTWTWTTMGSILDIATGATPLRANSAYYGGSVPWVTSGAVNDELITTAKESITDLALAETNAKIFPPGTLLIAMYGEGQTRGKVAELGINAATNQAVAALLFDETTNPLRPYLRLFLLSNYLRMRELSFGGVQPNLSLSIVKDMFVPIPPLEEQSVICQEAERVMASLDQAESRIERADLLAQRAADAVAGKTFRGEMLSVAVASN